MSDTPKYTFLPWLKQGIANEVTEVENKGNSTTGDNLVRANMQVKLKITGTNSKNSNSQVETVPRTVSLIGPGDIVGMDPSAIVKTEPMPGLRNFESNFLPYIDFYDEDFAWRYSPALENSHKQLRPWLFLFVLKDDEFTYFPASSTALPSISITGGANAAFLPKADEIALWAHVHVDKDLVTGSVMAGADVPTAITELTDTIENAPNKAHCRIISPRKLEEETNYTVFLIPSYETGRLAGLGEGTSSMATQYAQAPSWGPKSEDQQGGPTKTIHLVQPNRWPVYHRYSFATGDEGDFEKLVKELKPVAISDETIGRQLLDIQDPGLGINYQIEHTADEPKKTTLWLEGALRLPGTKGEPYPYPDVEDDINYDPATMIAYRTSLEHLVNLGEDMKAATYASTAGNSHGKYIIDGESVDDDPIVAPPLYGRWHARASTVDADDTSIGGDPFWTDELNCDPRHRATAGLGAKIIRDNQDEYMNEAWDQYEGVVAANARIKRTQMSIAASSAMHTKHIQSQPDEKVWMMIGTMSRRMKNSAKTYYQEAKESTLPLATQRGAMRKMMRPRGPVMRRIDPTQKINSGTNNLIAKLDDQTVLAAQPKAPPALAKTKSLEQVQTSVNNVLNAAPFPYDTAPVGAVPAPAASDPSQAIALQSALGTLKNSLNGVVVPAAARSPFDLSKAEAIKAQLKPELTISTKVNGSMKTVNKSGSSAGTASLGGGSGTTVQLVQMHPSFPYPMYKVIKEINTDFLITNLDLIPNNTISLLETNQQFIESLMAGLNHELSRELLWNEFPTDQRGTYFRQFWDKTAAAIAAGNGHDIDPMTNWGSKLGNHGVSTSGSDNLVLVMRGDFLRKFPNTVIYAVRAKWVLDDQDNPIYTEDRVEDTSPGSVREPIFMAKIEPDLTFIGMDITLEEAKGDDPDNLPPGVTVADPGYFFVLKEVPGEVRFGMDVPPSPPETFATWSDLHWGRTTATDRVEIGSLTVQPNEPKFHADDSPVVWGSTMNASDMAMVLYQLPVKVLIHARKMLPNPLTV